MADVVSINVPGAPVGKGRPRFVKSTGRVYTPSPTRKYEDRVRATAERIMDGRSPLDGALEVGVMAIVPIPESWSKTKRSAAARGLIRPTSRPDADNYLKIACDALNGIVWRDDSQITDTQIRKRYGHEPSLQIFVRQIAQAELLAEAA